MTLGKRSNIAFACIIAFFVILAIITFKAPEDPSDSTGKFDIPVNVTNTNIKQGTVSDVPTYNGYEESGQPPILSIPVRVLGESRELSVLITGPSSPNYRQRFMEKELKVGDTLSFYIAQITEYLPGPTGPIPKTVSYGILKNFKGK